MLKEHCKKCGCLPCHCKEIEHARKHGTWKCESCGTKLHLRGGYLGTDMCGVCCCGTAEELESEGIDW